MKTTGTLPYMRNRISIEIFDLNLLKETRLLADDEDVFESDNYSENWIEEETDIPEMSFGEFENLLSYSNDM